MTNPFQNLSLHRATEALSGARALTLSKGFWRSAKFGTVATCPFVTYVASIGAAIYAVLLIGLVLHMNTAPLIVLGVTAGGLAAGLVFTFLDITHLESRK